MPASQTPTLADIPDLLTDEDTRRRVTVASAREETGAARFWTAVRQLVGDGPRVAMTAPLLNKLRAFLLREFVRDSRRARLHHRPSGRSSTAGSCWSGSRKVYWARRPPGCSARSSWPPAWQAAVPPREARRSRPPGCRLYLDEFHNFLTLPYPMEDMLAEARGYRLSLIIAHQNLAQLPGDLREGISANARNKVFFTCSPEDARALTQHTTPQLTEHDLSHLGGYQAAVRLRVDGVAVPAFTMRTRSLPPAVPGRAARVRELSEAVTAACRDALARGGKDEERQAAA